MPRLIDLTGEKFGEWEVLERGPNKDGKPGWLCRCGCGTERVVSGSNLRTGLSSNCGCIRKSKISERNFSHGETGTRLYNIWTLIKGRTTNPSNVNYKNYGGRGITVCDEWLAYEPFRDWSLSNGYSDDLSVDRIDNDKGYCPDNCRWATAKQQGNNTRRNRFINHGGELHTVSEWAKILGIKRSTLHKRIFTLGWPIEKAFKAL